MSVRRRFTSHATSNTGTITTKSVSIDELSASDFNEEHVSFFGIFCFTICTFYRIIFV
jgi:hypothetical protein